MPSSRGALQLVAALEAFKGVVVLLVATGLLALLHQDVHGLAVVLVEHAHLNPASKYPLIFLDAAAHADDAHLWQLAGGAAAYSALRLVEGFGLYRERAWAEVVAALSGAIYVPFEVAELFRHPSGLAAVLLTLNVAVVALMVVALNNRRKAGPPGSP
jgi:uncharacterized membrane protein (DUF2068 family)